jgi:hypothetical protein
MGNIIYPVAKGESSERERNDCTVRALANATGMAYSEAHSLLSKHGRKFKCGAFFMVYHRAYLEAGLALQGIYGSTRRARIASSRANVTAGAGITIGRMLPRLQQGRYVVLITGHALAVVDGRIIDAGGQRSGSHVFAVYKVPTKNQ